MMKMIYRVNEILHRLVCGGKHWISFVWHRFNYWKQKSILGIWYRMACLIFMPVLNKFVIS